MVQHHDLLDPRPDRFVCLAKPPALVNFRIEHWFKAALELERYEVEHFFTRMPAFQREAQVRHLQRDLQMKLTTEELWGFYLVSEEEINSIFDIKAEFWHEWFQRCYREKRILRERAKKKHMLSKLCAVLMAHITELRHQEDKELAAWEHQEYLRWRAAIPQRVYEASQLSGLFVVAPSGWGKSRLLGRNICYVNARAGIGTVVIDVVGATIDNALDKVAHLDPDSPERRETEARIRYCNMAGQDGYVTSWPMLYRKNGESLFQASQRAVDLLARMDPSFTEASIQGFKRAAAILTPIAMVLIALDLSIIHIFDILAYPEKWKKKIIAAGMRDPEALEAAAEVLDFLDLKDWKREERSEPLRNRLALLKYDPVSKAMFTAKTPSIDWEEVAYKGLQVYIDLSHESSDMAREMKLFWVWQDLFDYIASRGGRGKAYYPLAVVIDELTFFIERNTLNADVLARDFRELSLGRRRNANVWLTVATQDMEQLPEPLLKACLQMGSHLYGKVLDFETALGLAKRWYKVDPFIIKMSKKQGTRIPITLNKAYKVPHSRKWFHWQETYYKYLPPDQEAPPAFLSMEEQDYLNSLNFRELEKGMWLFAKSPGEGEYPTELEEIPTHHIDEGQYPRDAELSKYREMLMQRDGIPMRQRRVLPKSSVPAVKTNQPPPVDGEPILPDSYAGKAKRIDKRSPSPPELTDDPWAVREPTD